MLLGVAWCSRTSLEGDVEKTVTFASVTELRGVLKVRSENKTKMKPNTSKGKYANLRVVIRRSLNTNIKVIVHSVLPVFNLPLHARCSSRSKLK